MRSRANLQLAAFLSVLASPRFLGASRGLEVSDRVERPLAFDPLALVRRPPRKERRRHGYGAHTSARQAARYARQISAASFNVHHDARLRWNETVYPRVLELQAKQRERR